MQWKTQINGKETIANAPGRFLHDQEREVTVAGQKILARYHPDLKTIFYRTPDSKCYRNINVRSHAVNKSEGMPEYNVSLELRCPATEEVHAFLGETWVYTPASEQRRKAQAAMGAILRSPMTGKILKSHIKNGDEVQKGDVLLVIEAMKMENNIAAPASGLIEDFASEVGQNVNANDLICKIKPSGDS